MNYKMLNALVTENETCFKALLSSSFIPHKNNILNEIKNTLSNAGIDNFIYESMVGDIIKGNFAVIYLDSRLIYDKKREKAAKSLNHIREFLMKGQIEGKQISELLFW